MKFVLLLFAACTMSWPEEMAAIPAGEFTMGRNKLTPDDKTTMRPHILLDDRPTRKVRIDAFQLDKHEVTNQSYGAYLKATKRTPPYHWRNGVHAEGADQVPVYNVNWAEAKAFCEWAGKRLPTEAEWERAARGGKEGLSYPDGDKIDNKLARFASQSGAGPVASYPANAFGLFDMAGNVSEWTADWFDEHYYERGENENPKGPATGVYKVIRGGAWSDSAPRITVFFRNWVRPTQRTPNIGFRCAR